MWPFDVARDVLRVGRAVLEYWTPRHGGLVRLAATPLAGDGRRRPGAEALRDTLSHLLSAVEVTDSGHEGLRGRRCVDIVVESAWMPAIALELDGRFWAAHKLDALLAHQLDQLYGPPPEGGWRLRHDYRVGDSWALGFGVAEHVLRALQDGLAAQAVTAASVQPALAWSWQRCARQRSAAKAPWWMCVEQDRTLVCHVDGEKGGRIDSLNAGASPVQGPDDLSRLLAIEGLRLGLGVQAGGALAVAWNEPAPGAALQRTPADTHASAGAVQWLCWAAATSPGIEAMRRSVALTGSP